MKYVIEKIRNKPFVAALIVIIIIMIIAGSLFLSQMAGKSEDKTEIITVSTLEKIINVSKLSTFTAVYNGVAQVIDKENPENIKYYVSYEARVDAGIDFEKINIKVEEEEDKKMIHITLPKVHITKTTVDIASLDYIFIDKNSDASSVSQEAYKACEKDAKDESEQEESIYMLAKQNAENIMKALINPFIEQLDSTYELIIEWEE